MEYYASVELDVTSSSATIQTTIGSAFQCVPIIAAKFTGGLIENWRLLLRIDGEKGQRGLLRIFKNAPEVTIQHIKDAMIDNRIPKYKNTIFILLPEGQSDLPIDAEFFGRHSKLENLDIADQDGEQNDGDDERNSQIYKPSNPTSSLPHDVEERESANNDNHKSNLDSGNTGSSSIFLLYRLSFNLRADGEKTFEWWPAQVSGPYIAVHSALTTLVAKLDRAMASPTMSMLQIASIDSGSNEFKKSFTHNFRLGPHGLHPVTVFLHRVYAYLSSTDSLDSGFRISCIETVERVAFPMLELLLHFRSAQFRGEYDPPGFCEFQNVLKHGHALLGEADVTDRLRILGMNLLTSDPLDVKVALVDDFGSYDSASGMTNNKLLTGVHGLHGLLQMVEHFLDDFPLNDPRYEDYFKLFRNLSTALTRKVINFKKSHSKKKAGSSAHSSTMETSEAEMGPGSRTRSTRSSTSGSDVYSAPSDSNSTTSECSSDSFSVHEYTPNADEYAKFGSKSRKRPAQWVDVSDSDDYLPTMEEEFLRRARRPRTEYPKTEARREYTSREPPREPPRPKPRPRPRAKAGPSRQSRPSGTSSTNCPEPVTDIFDRLSTISDEGAFFRTILTHYPHPNPNPAQRTHWCITKSSEFYAKYQSEKSRLHALLLQYHPDRNSQESEGWKERCNELSKVLNDRAEKLKVRTTG
ncbi:hypothetical protein GALMADRAFT_159340 [Galerina marginata CBS 339.88]|uniref:J domain-containing protein n=1 Tax=Galerina marginata (strain CBS 339.88) TaxID=685588 RepID=A0A067SNB3_GALM3|nr:hypothetical protein GALMADRAFT_159340 [Galerina marginata CBS 339.88]